MKSLVIIDDEFFFRKSMYAYMEKQDGYKIIGEANNGVSGTDVIQELRPDIALVDISMPIMDGLKMIKGLYGHTNTHFILLTGYGEFEYAKRAITLGVHDYLLKPLDSRELMDSLEKLTKEIDTEQQKQYVKSEEDLKNLVLDTYSEALKNLNENKATRGSKMIQHAKNYISRHYMEPELQLKTIASALYVSPQYLCSAFSQEIHITLGTYINHYRMQKAKELLLSDSPSIQNTALLCGFTDAGYFSKCFKKYYGISPKKFLLLKED